MNIDIDIPEADGLAFWRGLGYGLLFGSVLWAGIITAVVAWLT